MSFRCKVFYRSVQPTVGGFSDAVPVRLAIVEPPIPEDETISGCVISSFFDPFGGIDPNMSLSQYGRKVRKILFTEGFELAPNVWIAPGAIIRVDIEEKPE